MKAISHLTATLLLACSPAPSESFINNTNNKSSLLLPLHLENSHKNDDASRVRGRLFARRGRANDGSLSHKEHNRIQQYLQYSSILTILFQSEPAFSVFDFSDISQELRNPEVESEIFADMAHVALDVFSFLTPERVLLRFAAVVGRILSIASDYVPDHFIRTDEMVFQFAMLAISGYLFWNTAFSMIGPVDPFPILGGGGPSSSSGTVSKLKQRYTYEHLFKQTGLSWFQFIVLVKKGVISWDTVDVGEEFISSNKNKESSSEYLFWVYRGEADLIFNGSPLKYVQASKTKKPPKSFFLADLEFMDRIEEMKLALVRNSSPIEIEECRGDSEEFCREQAVIRAAGPTGAKVLRINKSKLLEEMSKDTDLIFVIEELLSKGIQRKLSVILSFCAESSMLSVDDDNTTTSNSTSATIHDRTRQPNVTASKLIMPVF